MNTGGTVRIKDRTYPILSIWLTTVIDGDINTCDVCHGGYEQFYIVRTPVQVFTVCGDCFDNTVKKED